ncbi:MAG: Uma2 family endonuclease, partial [Armatimonadetes bacterium]|nr:Uma2 family endonuclease [Armatimonadota bacterium]
MSATEAAVRVDAPAINAPAESEADRLRRQILAIVVPEPRKMSYQEFLAWLDEDTLAEWVDGEVVLMSPAKREHQNVADFLLRTIADYVEAKGLGEVISAPFQMKLERGREPDLIFVATEHLPQLQETFLDGPADLVVEVASEESRSRDRGEK